MPITTGFRRWRLHLDADDVASGGVLTGDHIDLVGVEGGIGRHDGDVQDLRLSDQKPVKRIAMVVGQPCGLQRVRVLDGKRLDPIAAQANENELVGMLGKVELPYGVLDRNLPR